MCYCNPSIRTPNCGSAACTEAAKDVSMREFLRSKETPSCCDFESNKCWNNTKTKFVCFHCGKKHEIKE